MVTEEMLRKSKEGESMANRAGLSMGIFIFLLVVYIIFTIAGFLAPPLILLIGFILIGLLIYAISSRLAFNRFLDRAGLFELYEVTLDNLKKSYVDRRPQYDFEVKFTTKKGQELVKELRISPTAADKYFQLTDYLNKRALIIYNDTDDVLYLYDFVKEESK